MEATYNNGIQIYFKVPSAGKRILLLKNGSTETTIASLDAALENFSLVLSYDGAGTITASVSNSDTYADIATKDITITSALNNITAWSCQMGTGSTSTVTGNVVSTAIAGTATTDNYSMAGGSKTYALTNSLPGSSAWSILLTAAIPSGQTGNSYGSTLLASGTNPTAGSFANGFQVYLTSAGKLQLKNGSTATDIQTGISGNFTVELDYNGSTTITVIVTPEGGTATTKSVTLNSKPLNTIGTLCSLIKTANNVTETAAITLSSTTTYTNAPFVNCPALTKVILPATLVQKGTDAVASTVKLYVPSTATKTLDAAKFWKNDVLNIGANVTIGESGYASFYTDAATTIPAGVTAYTAGTATNGNLPLTAIEGTTLAANTGIIMTGTAGDYFFEGTTNTATQTSSLSGTTASMDTPTTGCYVLGYESSQAGMYKYTGATLEPNKVYLTTTGGGSLRFTFGTTTGIKTATKVATEGQAYDLQGRKTDAKQAGIYIINGKKIIK